MHTFAPHVIHPLTPRSSLVEGDEQPGMPYLPVVKHVWNASVHVMHQKVLNAVNTTAYHWSR